MYLALMQEITLSVNRAQVYKEVAKISSYAGAKTSNGENYARVFAVKEDKVLLDKFWGEHCNRIINELKPLIESVNDINDCFSITLSVSTSYDTALSCSIEGDLFDYLVAAITARWFSFVDENKVNEYSADAAAKMTCIKQKIYHHKKPTRISI